MLVLSCRRLARSAVRGNNIAFRFIWSPAYDDFVAGDEIRLSFGSSFGGHDHRRLLVMSLTSWSFILSVTHASPPRTTHPTQSQRTMMTLRDVEQNSSRGHDHACSPALEATPVFLVIVVILARCKCLPFPSQARLHFRVSLLSLDLAPLVFASSLFCRSTEATTC